MSASVVPFEITGAATAEDVASLPWAMPLHNRAWAYRNVVVEGRALHETSFLIPLSAVAAVAGAVVEAGEACVNGTLTDMCVHMSAVVGEAAIFAAMVRTAGPSAVMGYLGLTFTALEAMESINGFGSSNTGDAFRNGDTTFSNDINNILTEAYPNPDYWYGAGAVAYSAGNQEQQGCVQQVAEADRQIADRVKAQAEKIEQAREVMAYCRFSVIGAIPVVAALDAAWRYWCGVVPAGATIAAAIANAAHAYGNYIALLAALADLGIIIDLLVVGAKSGRTFNNVTDIYKGIVDKVDAQNLTDAATVGMPTALMSIVSGLSDLAATPSDTAGESDNAFDRQALLDASDTPAVMMPTTFTLPALANRRQARPQQPTSQVRHLVSAVQRTSPSTDAPAAGDALSTDALAALATGLADKAALDGDVGLAELVVSHA